MVRDYILLREHANEKNREYKYDTVRSYWLIDETAVKAGQCCRERGDRGR